MEETAKRLCEASLAASSSQTYKAAQKMFREFCAACGMRPLPASEQLLILFVANLSTRVCHSTARTYLAAVRHLHISEGHGDPLKGCLQLELVLKGFKRWKPRSQDQRLPITPWILQKIKAVVLQNPHEYDNILFWAACCLGFFAFLRSSLGVKCHAASKWWLDCTVNSPDLKLASGPQQQQRLAASNSGSAGGKSMVSQRARKRRAAK